MLGEIAEQAAPDHDVVGLGGGDRDAHRGGLRRIGLRRIGHWVTHSLASAGAVSSAMRCATSSVGVRSSVTISTVATSR